MKRTLLTLLSVLFCAITFAQSVPQGINYQAVARDANGDVLMNQSLTIQFSVISDITTSAVSWQETHTVSTNDYGLYTAIIGQGTATSVGSSATFDVIDWGASNHLLKVEVDYGNGLLDMGTTAFMSVPYALNSSTISAVTYSIGDTAQGGIVFSVSHNGKNGLVVAENDQHWGVYSCFTYNFNATGEIASQELIIPSNYTTEGQKYTDWRIPTLGEMWLINWNLHQQGLGNLNDTAVSPYGITSVHGYMFDHPWNNCGYTQSFKFGSVQGSTFGSFNSAQINEYPTAKLRAVRVF